MRDGSAMLLATSLAVLLAGCDGDFSGLVPPTVDDDASLPALQLSSTRVHAQTFGDPANPVIIVMHGGPGSDYRSMLSLAELASDGYFVVFWDHRGSGLSRRHECAELGPNEFTRDVEEMVDHYSRSPTDRVSFIGHSWGAMYATLYTNLHPDRVDRLVFAEPGAFNRTELDAFMKKLMGEVGVTGELFNDAAYLNRIVTPDDQARADFDIAQSSGVLDGPLGIDPAHGEPYWRMGALANTCLPDNTGSFDWTTNLSAYGREVLFLHGERNRVHTLEHQRSLAAHYPNARVVTIPGVGHDMFSAAPQAVLALVRAELEVQP